MIPPTDPTAGLPWRRLLEHPGTSNFAWLAGDKCVRMVVGVLVVSWVARHLGAAQFGLFIYVTVWIAIVTGVAALGMDALVVRDIVKRPEVGGTLLGTAIGFRAAASAFGGLLVVGLVGLLRRDEPQAVFLVALLSCGAVLQALESGELWFQSRLEMRRLVVPRLGLFLIINAVKLAMILRGAGLTAFVLVSAVELSAGGLLTWAMVRWARSGVGRLRFDYQQGLTLARECLPLALSGLVVVLYIRITGLLVAGLLNDVALGIYAAATRITEATYFVGGTLASSLLPWILKQRDQGVEKYQAARLRFFRLNALIGYTVLLPFAIGGPWLVSQLYGAKFVEAGPVLQVHAWTILFAFSGVARGQHFLNERQTGWALRFSIWGLLLNVALCLALIPAFGLMGAAWGAVISYALSSVGSSFFFRQTRPIGVEQIRGIFTPLVLFSRKT